MNRSCGLYLVAMVLGACQGTSSKDLDSDTATSDSGTSTHDTGRERTYASEFVLVDIPEGTSAPTYLAVQACAGLKNREVGGSVYVDFHRAGANWMEALELTPAEVLLPDAFLATCTTEFTQCVRYDYAAQRKIMPAILTAAAALGAMPLDVNLDLPCDKVVFDATVELAKENTPALATKLVFDRFGDKTTGLAMTDPGYDQQATDKSDPPIGMDMIPHALDYVFSERLFALFLVNGCETGHPENVVLDEVVNTSNWPKPLPVYGYNSSWLIGGYLHEAQTRCLESRNMGAVATSTNNLSFFSTRRPWIESRTELAAIPPQTVAYDPNKTYVAFVVGDGDNVSFILHTRNVWVQQRLKTCEETPALCAPLTWTISPHLPQLTPDVLVWYYKQLASTGHDYIALPPSGHLYAYPSSLAPDIQDEFIKATEADANLLGTASVVHWDWNSSWGDAMKTFLPRYVDAGVVQGIIPVNVPYLIEPFPGWPSDKFNEVLGDKVVVFRSREWRGVNSDSDKFFFTPTKMAEELNNYPAGSVHAIYMTSDGGLDLNNSFTTLISLLDSDVVLVSSDAAAKLAIEASH